MPDSRKTDEQGPVEERPTARGRSRRGSALDVGFDRWLNKQLHKLYDPVMKEEIPDDISDLLKKFAQKPIDEGK